MKRNLLAIAALMLVAGTVSAQTKKDLEVPAAAEATFAKSFPGASGVKWEKEGAEFEVNFKQSGKSMSAVIDAAGQLKETEQDIAVSELPVPAMDYIKKNYAGKSIKEAAMITRAGGEVVYEAEVNKQDLIFSKAGVFQKVAKD